jgi:hypothetical protein
MGTRRSQTSRAKDTEGAVPDYYAVTFGLRGVLKIACTEFTASGEFEQTARRYARVWLEQLGPQLPDSVACRRNLFIHLVRGFLDRGLDTADKFLLVLAVSLAMTDRVQQLVDRHERRLHGRN